MIDTDMNAHLSAEDVAALAEETPLGRIGTPEQVASALWDLSRAEFITGQILSVNGGLCIT
jgi:3-oxoacyl-[acyl-carrier protein] reductase